MRPDVTWRRSSALPAREDVASAELVTAAAWVHTRARARRQGLREWTELDARTIAEVQARSWGFGELQELKMWTTPAWFALLELPQRARGYERFLGALCRAYRAGATGLELSYEEAMALFDVGSSSTWWRWVKELEGAELVRVVQLRRQDGARDRYGRCHYRIGRALEELAGVALCEDAAAPGGPSATWCARIAVGLRRRARDARRARKAELWHRHNRELAAALAVGRWLAAPAPTAPQGGVSVPGLSTVEGQSPPPSEGGETTRRPSGSAEQAELASLATLAAPPPAEPRELEAPAAAPTAVCREGDCTPDAGLVELRGFLERIEASVTERSSTRGDALSELVRALGGKGDTFEDDECPECGGHGRVRRRSPPAPWRWVDCPTCGGSGRRQRPPPEPDGEGGPAP